MAMWFRALGSLAASYKGLRPREATGSSQPGLGVMHPLSQQKQKAANSRGEPAVCRHGVQRHPTLLCVATFLRNGRLRQCLELCYFFFPMPFAHFVFLCHGLAILSDL